MRPGRRVRALLVVSAGVLQTWARAFEDSTPSVRSVPREYATIAAAVDAAETWDTISVDADAYVTEGPVIVTKDLIVESSDPSTISTACPGRQGAAWSRDRDPCPESPLVAQLAEAEKNVLR